MDTNKTIVEVSIKTIIKIINKTNNNLDNNINISNNNIHNHNIINKINIIKMCKTNNNIKPITIIKDTIINNRDK